MKKIVICLLSGIIGMTAYGQNGTNSVADSTSRALADFTSRALADSSTKQATVDPKKNTGDMNQKWSGLLSGVANLFGSSGNSITINPTLYTLMHPDSINRSKVNYSAYRKEWFARNLQINLSATPDNKNSFQVDSGGIGFKYTILNNQSASNKDYKKLNYLLTNYDAILQYILVNLPAGPNHDNIYQTFVGSGKFDEAVLPNGLVQAVKNQFNLKGTLHDALTPEGIKNALDYKLKIKPLWTLTVNENYAFQSKETNALTVSTEFSYFLHFISKDKADTTLIPIDLTVSYGWQVDTMATAKVNNLDRHIFGINFGKDFTFKTPSWLEIKPSVSYVHIDGPLYKKESEDAFKANVTPRLKVNSQFWIPITISWDPKNGQIFGFLTVQYSFS